MLFEYRAVYEDGHVELVSEVTPTLARDRARLAHPGSPLVRMIDGWGSVKWDVTRDPARYNLGWTAREQVGHAVAAPGRAICGVKIKTLTRRLFDPLDTAGCGTCRREARR